MDTAFTAVHDQFELESLYPDQRQAIRAFFEREKRVEVDNKHSGEPNSVLSCSYFVRDLIKNTTKSAVYTDSSRLI